MIVAGDIGGKSARLGCFTIVKERLKLVCEEEYGSREHQGLDEIYTTAERDALVNGLVSGTLSRANALQHVAEDSRFIAAKFSEQFVLMEYFGLCVPKISSGV
jgi:glucokinase